jgi:hypothetical protein
VKSLLRRTWRRSPSPFSALVSGVGKNALDEGKAPPRPPTGDLIAKRITHARARHDRQAIASGQINPMNFGTHHCSNERRCGTNNQSYQNVSRETFW